MANTSATLKNPFEGHQDVKTFREQADGAKSKLSSFQSDVQSKIETSSTSYLAAAEASASNWPSDDNPSKEQLAHCGSAITILLTSVTSDLANIIGDVEKVSSNIKDIEDKYEKAKKYVPGCYMKDGHAVSGDVDGAVWNDKDNERIIQANKELPDLVAEAEKQMQSIADAAGAVKLGIDAEAMKTGNFGSYVPYENDIVQREGKASVLSSVLSFLAGMAAGMLNDGENVIDLILTGVQSLIGVFGGDGSWLDGIIEAARNSNFTEGMVRSLVEKFGGDLDSYENGKKWGQLGTIVGCHFLGPVGSLLYALSTLGKEVKNVQAEGKELTLENLAWPIGKSILAYFSNRSLIGMGLSVLFNTDLGTELIQNVVSGIPLLGSLFGGSGSGGLNLGDLFSNGWETVKGWFTAAGDWFKGLVSGSSSS